MNLFRFYFVLEDLFLAFVIRKEISQSRVWRKHEGPGSNSLVSEGSHSKGPQATAVEIGHYGIFDRNVRA